MDKKEPTFHGWKIVSALIVAGAIFYSGLIIGKSSVPTVATGEADWAADGPLGASTTLVWDALRIAKDKYVHINDVKEEDFLYGAIEGIIGALGDPYSTFFRPEDAKKFDEDIRGNFGGIGAEIGKKEGELIIVAPLKGNPAEAAGLKAKDKIVKIDDTFAADLSVEEAVKIIRGEIGTKVGLLIMREGWDRPRDFEIARANIVLPTLDWEMLKAPGEEEANVAYIALHSFNGNASQAFNDAVFQALFRGTKGVILDLRNNSGGFLDVAVDIAGHFLERGEMVTGEKFRSGEVRKLISRGNGSLRNLPVVVLVNGGSASASEILAGALRDQNGAILVGEKTFGKGSVQELETLKDGSTLKISTAEWITPNGNSINKVGLAPDVEIKLEEPKAPDSPERSKDENPSVPTKEGTQKPKDIQKEAALKAIAPLLGRRADSPLTIEVVQ
ncbi:MAG: S41 family peptidase [Nanoarchaeota archaeon]|nr:S41 family peptidase [Nanoarchaeota archaeon]